MVVQRPPVIAQRVAIVQPVVRPVIGHHVQRSEQRCPRLLAASCIRNPCTISRREAGVPRVKGAEQDSHGVRIQLLSNVGVPRERPRQNKLIRHDTKPDTLRASETTRAYSRVQRL